LTHDIRGLEATDVKGIEEWLDFYTKSDKYFHVGRVLNPPIDPNSPIPEPCKDEPKNDEAGQKPVN
jgi:hypothetical protein